MGREHQIISALGPTPVPVAPAIGFCDDEAVNGAPFYVMGFVDGHILRDADDRHEACHAEQRRARRASRSRRRAGRHPRRRRRRRRARRPRPAGGLHRAPAQALVRPVRAVEDRRRGPRSSTSVHRLLRRACPSRARPRSCTATTASTTRMLGDDGRVRRRARLGDLHARRPARRRRAADGLLVRAGRSSRRAARRTRPRSTASPRAQEMPARYAEQSGRDVSQLDFYVAFGYWKLACILEGVYARYVGGAGRRRPQRLRGLRRTGRQALAELPPTRPRSKAWP